MTVLELDLSEGHRITFHQFDPENRKTLICFSFQGGGMEKKGFGYPVCEKNGWNYIYVGKKKQTNFKFLSIGRFAEAVSPVLGDSDVIAYGVSAGANAALFFGGSVNARILAASPRNSSQANYDLPLADAPVSRHRPVILFDPAQRRDSRLVDEWVTTRYPDARLIRIPGAGHKTLVYLKQLGSLPYLLNTFVAGGEIDVARLLPKPKTVCPA